MQHLVCLQHAARSLGRARRFTIFCALTIGLSVGISAAVYAVIRATLFAPRVLAYSERLVTIYGANPYERGGLPSLSLSWTEWQALQDQSSAFGRLAAYGPLLHPLLSGSEAKWAWGEAVTGDYFTINQARPATGRLLDREDHVTNARAVAVVSERLWTTLWGRSPDAIGRTIRIHGIDIEVVGVADPSFRGAFNPELIPTDFWVPARLGARLDTRSLDDPDDRWLLVRGLLHRPEDLDRAASELGVISSRMPRRATPGFGVPPARPWTAVRTADIRYNGQDKRFFRPIARIVMAGMAILLLVTAFNLANLALSRHVAREHERDIKVSLGASSGALMLEHVAENILLALLGGLVAIPVALIGISLLRTQLAVSAETTLHLDPRPDPAVFLAGLLGCLLVALIVTLLPASRTARRASMRRQADAGQIVSLRRGSRRTLLLGQIAAAALFLSIAANGAATAWKIRSDQVGTLEELAIVRLTSTAGTMDANAAARLHHSLADRGVEGVAVTTGVPGLIQGARGQLSVGGTAVNIEAFGAAGPLLSVLGIDLLQGSMAAASGECVVTASAATRLWGTADVVGRVARLQRTGKSPVDCRVSGIVADSDSQRDAESLVLIPAAEEVRSRVLLLARSPEPMALARAIAAATQTAAPAFGVTAVQTGREALGPQTLVVRVATGLSVILGAVALGLSILGIYAVMSQIALARTREMGLRLALGGSMRQVIRAFAMEGMQPIVLGLLVGCAAGLVLLEVLQPAFANRGVHVWVTVSVQAVILATALVACLIPLRRAARAPIATTLRSL